MYLTGSICLSDIPRECIKKVVCKDGVTRYYLNISIGEKKTPLRDDKGNVVYDHYISCAPKKEERIDGVKYFIGDMRQWQESITAKIVTPEQIAAAPPLAADDPTDDLPF